MRFHNPLQPARLQQRYKRFLADVDFPDSGQPPLTIHCPNTGAMTGCAEPGMRVWMSDSDNPKRKYRYTWELAETGNGEMICVNTQRANQVAHEALKADLIKGIGALSELRGEVAYGYDKRRIDWFGLDQQQRETYIEVKSVTLADGQQGFFPDTVSIRAQQHLLSLTDMVNEGHRGIVLYVVLHSGIRQVQAAGHIDPGYAKTCVQAAAAGVEFYALQCQLTPDAIEPRASMPVKGAEM
ncbi:DNA/RNA nuclease SfsA [Pseudidiomarina sp.]|uniref:DNA/RNA nuclease SfsA n=1 Tax=Pseudidiomarina sp. TaxID=2081707 RepID=UPI00299DA993|nr:DNA/RNA nuclease SfsA [Pseudidiomarina sp.]MDX1706451.1 DNA/RNA nuclease SfsA [Pseudidiomarina sp.]